VDFAGKTTGTSPLLFQWFKDGLLSIGATNPILEFRSVAGSNTGEQLIRQRDGFADEHGNSAWLQLFNWPAKSASLVANLSVVSSIEHRIFVGAFIGFAVCMVVKKEEPKSLAFAIVWRRVGVLNGAIQAPDNVRKQRAVSAATRNEIFHSAVDLRQLCRFGGGL